jgi:hypothetical protein
MKMLLAAALLLAPLTAAAAEKVFFIEPKDGATVTSPVKVRFGLEGMKIGTLGDLTPGHGHHHLIINGKPLAKGEVVPADKTHIHYGKGQTEAEVDLAPGTYTLTMQFADGAHRSYGPEMSATVNITVQPAVTAKK